MAKVVLGIVAATLWISAMACWLISNIYYQIFLKQIAVEDAENGEDIEHPPAGRWLLGLDYYMRPPMPIIREARDVKNQRTIKRHNNLVKMFWLVVMLVVIDIVLLVIV